jgi:hypothetical protein
MPRYERILPVIGMVLMGMGLILLVQDINTLTFTIRLPGDVDLYVSIAWLILFLLLIVMTIGTESVQRVEDESLTVRRLHPEAWIVPVLLVLAAFLFLGGPVFDLIARGIGLALLGALLLAELIGQYYSHDDRPAVRNWSNLALDLLVYVTAFFLYGAVYGQRVRSLISATSLVVFSFLLALALLHRHGNKWSARLYAAIIGLCVGQVTWPLNYWVISGMFGGAFLLFVFYALVNPARLQLQGKLTWRAALEYVVVGLVGIAGIGVYAFLWPR